MARRNERSRACSPKMAWCAAGWPLNFCAASEAAAFGSGPWPGPLLALYAGSLEREKITPMDADARLCKEIRANLFGGGCAKA